MIRGSILCFLFSVILTLILAQATSTMLKTCSPSLRVAYRYCALSNLHNLDAIRQMIEPEGATIYGSRGVGNIMHGMKNFYEKYHDVFWVFKSIKEEEGSQRNEKADTVRILIDFDRYWTVRNSPDRNSPEDQVPPIRGEVFCSSASEYIEVTLGGGLVRSIAYCCPPSDPVLFGSEYPECRQQVLTEDRRIIEESE